MSGSPGIIYENLWNDPNVMISWHNKAGAYKAASPGSSKVIGWPHEKMPEVDPYSLLHADDIAVIGAYHERLWSEQYKHEYVIYRIKGQDGKFRWVRTQTKRGEHPDWGPVTVSVSYPHESRDAAAILTPKGELLEVHDLRSDIPN